MNERLVVVSEKTPVHVRLQALAFISVSVFK